jgi:hypothetical protein
MIGVKFALEVAIAETVEGELAGEQGLEEGDVFRGDGVEGRDVVTGFAL